MTTAADKCGSAAGLAGVVTIATRWLVVATLAVFLAFAADAQESPDSQRRVALIIGNSLYDHVDDLANPVNDSSAMRDTLAGLGFEVFSGDNLKRTEFLDLVARFKTAAQSAETALIYYSGHGFQLRGLNYLVPQDAELKSQDAIGSETIRLDDLIAGIEGPDRQTLVFLDACRNNPLPVSQRKDDGLAQVQTGNGVFVAFATQPGNISYDGRSKLSPFTKAITTHIGTPGQSISDMMIKVRNEVERLTLYQQTPWDQSSLRKQVYFNGGAPEKAASEEVAALDAMQQPGSEISDLQRATGINAGTHQMLESNDDMLVLPNVVPGAAPNVILIPEAPIEIFGREELVYAVQSEMSRIGCYDGEPDGVWGGTSSDALRRYYQTKKLRLQDTEPTEFHLDNLKREEGTVCTAPPPYKPRIAKRPKPEPGGPAETRRKDAPDRKSASRPSPGPRKSAAKASAPRTAKRVAANPGSAKRKIPAATQPADPPAARNSLENSRVLGSFR